MYSNNSNNKCETTSTANPRNAQTTCKKKEKETADGMRRVCEKTKTNKIKQTENENNGSKPTLVSMLQPALAASKLCGDNARGIKCC